MFSNPSSSWGKTQQGKSISLRRLSWAEAQAWNIQFEWLWVRAPVLVLSHCLAESKGTRLRSESPGPTPHAPSMGPWREKTQCYRSRRAGPAPMLRINRANLEDSKPEVAAFSRAHARASLSSAVSEPSMHSFRVQEGRKTTEKNNLPTTMNTKEVTSK